MMIESSQSKGSKTQRLEWSKIGALAKLRPSRPADWGAKVTVCIAAMANYGQSIIIATDQMVSTEVISADGTALKILGVHPNWAVMFAGSLEHVIPILKQVRADLEDKEPSYEEVEKSLVKAYQVRVEAEETNVVLGRYGLTMEEFLSTGPEKFGESAFARLMAEIEQVSLGPQGLCFLAAGYAANGGSHIFSVSHPGKAENHDVTGFWAIGSGQYGALASLFFHSYNKKFLPPTALYHVCEAKFMAERSGGVGEASSVLVLSLDPDYVGAGLAKIKVEEFLKVESLKKVWNKEGKPRVPKNLYQRMKDLRESQGAIQQAFLGFRRK